MASESRGFCPALRPGGVYEPVDGGPDRIRVVAIGEGGRAGQLLIEYVSAGRFGGQRWWWPADALDGWQRLPRGWDSTG